MRDRTYIIFLTGFLALAILLSFVLVKIPSASRAERLVENTGMQNAHVTHRGLAWGPIAGCKRDDVTKFTVKATDASGRTRTVEVCAPIIGGYTIRG